MNKIENSIVLGPMDGALIFQEAGQVEIILPVVDPEADLPNHLAPMIALSLILGDEKRLEEALSVMDSTVESYQSMANSMAAQAVNASNE